MWIKIHAKITMCKTITVIEDDFDLNSLIQIALKSQGYKVQSFSDGTELTGPPSDLYLLDINLGKGMTGMELCKKLKQSAPGTKAPVVILISANPDLRKMAIEACADDTLAKPFSTGALLRVVAKHCAPREAVSA